ncbi:hypothetical protein POJ06DRAFT_98882 [Lipomyces tetrasporus]|uniref:Uncharacterized protein n=1 Tax=Lipomyces tetrasporus TaxID=54092 RepID=A0AAD7QUD2_9ASCO|nr:uncharacterized protein POJ06DRAFT_98882 [Lipomyces tetrasporus]KAJ8101564.1 hypothetical protein POJ06DRAFT_98882 [Lipomyces tetrasporus]
MVSFSQLASHRNPVLHLYRALLHHANDLIKDAKIILPTTDQPLTAPITHSDALFLKRTIRRGFRRNRRRISLAKCKALLADTYAREQTLRLAARKYDPNALAAVRRHIAQAQDRAAYHSFSYRRNPPRTPEADAAYKARQRKETYIRMWAPGVRFRIPGLPDDRVREIAWQFHLKREQHLLERRRRYKAYHVKMPRLSFYQNAFSLPIFQKPFMHNYALARFLNRLRIDRQLMLDRIMEARVAVSYSAYADLDEKWMNELTGQVAAADTTFLQLGKESLTLLNKQLENARKYSRDSRQRTLRQLEFAKLEQLRNHSKQFKRMWRFSPDELVREASLLD